MEFFETTKKFDRIESLRLENIKKIKEDITESNKNLIDLKDKIQSSNSTIESKKTQLYRIIELWKIENKRLINDLDIDTKTINKDNLSYQNLIDENNDKIIEYEGKLKSLEDIINDECPNKYTQELKDDIIDLDKNIHKYENDLIRWNDIYMDGPYQHWTDSNEEAQLNYINEYEETTYDRNKCLSDNLFPSEPIIPSPPTKGPKPIPQYIKDQNKINKQIKDICEPLREKTAIRFNDELQELQEEIERNQRKISSNDLSLKEKNNEKDKKLDEHSKKRDAINNEIEQLENQIKENLVLKEKSEKEINILKNNKKEVEEQLKKYQKVKKELENLINDELKRKERNKKYGINEEEDKALKIERWRFIYYSYTPKERKDLGIPEFNHLKIPSLKILKGLEKINLNKITDLIDLRFNIDTKIKTTKFDFKLSFEDIGNQLSNISSPVNVNVDDEKWQITIGAWWSHTVIFVIIIIIIFLYIKSR